MPETKVVLPSTQNFLALPAGTVIGRYRITGLLGQGSFGITYRAHDDQLERDVAIKEYLPTTFAVRHGGLSVVPNSAGATEDFAWGRQRFVDEGRALAGFQRAPGIVRVHDFLEANGTAYIVMELVQGETLGARLQRQGRLTPAEVERILRALLEGLAKVHSGSFIHRDIKPDNILLDDDGQPTLIDFGAARAAVAGRTAALTGIFTPGYAAVEQFTDARQGPFTDIYGLSATLYQAITGRKPPSAIDRVLDDRYVPLAKSRPAGFAPALLAGIDRGMAVRPEARPQSIVAWRSVLFLEEAGEAPVAAKGGGPKAQERPARRRAAAIAGLAVVLAGGAGAGALFLFPLQEAPVAGAGHRQAERSAADATEADAEKRRAAEEETQRLAAVGKARREQAEADARQQAAAEQAEKDARQEAAAAIQRQAAAEEARRRAEEDTRAAAAMEEALRAAERAAREKEAREKAIAEDAARKASAEAEKAEAERARAQAARERAAAETAEAALHLGAADRQRIQVALTAQGFDTRGADGVLGPRSREMVAAWQAAHGLRATGFLDAVQRQRLLGGAAAAVARFDAEQKKAADEETRRSEQTRPGATTAALDPSRPVPETSPSAFAGRWSLVRSKCIPSTPQRFLGVTVEGNRFAYGFSFANRSASCAVIIRPDGSFANNACDAPMSGQVSGNRMTLSQRHPEIICDFEFQRQ